MDTKTSEFAAAFDIYVEITLSGDGTPIVHIDTPDLPEDSGGPKCRIYLNDETVFENPTFDIDNAE